MKNTITELKNTLEGSKSRLNKVEKRISECKERAVEFTQLEKKNKKYDKESKGGLRDLWDNIKWTNIHIIRAQKEKREEKEQKTYL